MKTPTPHKKKGGKRELRKWVDKMDAEIMCWFYEIVKINFLEYGEVEMVQDSSDLREILERNLKEILLPSPKVKIKKK